MEIKLASILTGFMVEKCIKKSTETHHNSRFTHNEVRDAGSRDFLMVKKKCLWTHSVSSTLVLA